jgi:hypothetical protein
VSEKAELHPDTLAYREYGTSLPEGRTASLAITLVRNDTDLPSGRVARLLRARAHGLVSILDYPNGPRHPLLWFQNEDQLGLCVADGDQTMAPELREIVKWYLSEFFLDVAAIDPELARLSERRSAYLT